MVSKKKGKPCEISRCKECCPLRLMKTQYKLMVFVNDKENKIPLEYNSVMVISLCDCSLNRLDQMIFHGRKN